MGEFKFSARSHILLWLSAGVQMGAVGARLWLASPQWPLYAQGAGVCLAVVAAVQLTTERTRFLRQRHRELTVTHAAHEAELSQLVEQHGKAPNR